MKCDICSKEYTFLYFIGKDSVCNKCIGKQTVFKEVSESEDALLRKALRTFNIKSFNDLKNLTHAQADKLAAGLIKQKRKKTIKYKKNKASAVSVGGGDTLDYQDELDIDA